MGTADRRGVVNMCFKPIWDPHNLCQISSCFLQLLCSIVLEFLAKKLADGRNKRPRLADPSKKNGKGKKEGVCTSQGKCAGATGGIEKGVGVREKSWGRRLTAPSCCPPLTTAGQCNIRAWSGRREAPPPRLHTPSRPPLALGPVTEHLPPFPCKLLSAVRQRRRQFATGFQLFMLPLCQPLAPPRPI